MKHAAPTSRLALALALPTLVALLLVVACSGGGLSPVPSPTTTSQRTVTTTSADLPMLVGVTLPVFADFVRELGGHNVEVFSIIPPDTDPHTYEPTPSDIQRIGQADIIFINDYGPGVEGSIPDLIDENRGEHTKVIPFMPNVQSPRAHELGDPQITAAEAGDNPHLWLDPMLARVYANIVADTFVIEDGINKAFYNDNLTQYGRRLYQLSEDIAAAIEEIPRESRKLVTTHDAFPHMARSFNLDLIGFVAPGAGQDPSPRDIVDLTQAIEDEDIPAVFVEPQIGANSRHLEQIVADSGVQVCTLYSDTLADDIPTYVDMMRSNADELLRCLGGGDG